LTKATLPDYVIAHARMRVRLYYCILNNNISKAFFDVLRLIFTAKTTSIKAKTKV